MNDEELLALWPCQLAIRNRDEIKRAVELGYDLSKKCISDDTGDDFIVTKSHDDCIWSQTPSSGCGLFTTMWDELFMEHSDDDLFDSDEFLCTNAISLLDFLYELYDGKIIFLQNDHNTNKDDYVTEDTLYEEYKEMGYEINCDPDLIERGLFQFSELFVYCLEKSIVDISSGVVLEMEKEANKYIDLHEPYDIVNDDDDYISINNAYKIQKIIYNLKQHKRHASLSDLMISNIDLEKEDLSASYYY